MALNLLPRNYYSNNLFQGRVKRHSLWSGWYRDALKKLSGVRRWQQKKEEGWWGKKTEGRVGWKIDGPKRTGESLGEASVKYDLWNKHNRWNKGNFFPHFCHRFPSAKGPKGPVGRTPSAEVLLLIAINWASLLSQLPKQKGRHLGEWVNDFPLLRPLLKKSLRM